MSRTLGVHDHARQLGQGLGTHLERAHAAQGFGNQRLVIERQFQFIGGTASHHPHRIAEHDFHEPDGSRTRVDRRGRVAVSHQGQSTNVVSVGVGDQDSVEGNPGEGGEIRQAILTIHAHTGINQSAETTNLDELACRANPTGPAKKLDVHEKSSLLGVN